VTFFASDVFSELTMTDIGAVVTTTALTVNSSAISGETIAFSSGAASVLTLNGSASADTIDAADFTDAGNDTSITIVGGAGADTITLSALVDTVTHNGNATDGADSITSFTSGTDKLNIDSTLVTAAGGKATDASTVTYAASAIIDDAADTAAADSETGVIWWVAEELASTTTAATAVANAVTELSDGAADFGANFATGEGGIVIMDNGSDTFLFEYKADGTPATTTADDLTLLATLVGVSDGDALVAADFA
jgi:hypothetical protein